MFSQTRVRGEGTMAGTLTSISDEDIEDAKHPMPKSPQQMEVPAHLTDLYRRSREGVPAEFHDKIAALLSNYTDVFSMNDANIGRTKCVKHSINTGCAA